MDFSPEKGNVAFASAHDGWAFRVDQFAAMHAPKMGIKPEKLAGIMWGEWAYDAKNKRAVKIKRSNAGKHTPLFVQVRPSQPFLCDSFVHALQLNSLIVKLGG